MHFQANTIFTIKSNILVLEKMCKNQVYLSVLTNFIDLTSHLNKILIKKDSRFI